MSTVTIDLGEMRALERNLRRYGNDFADKVLLRSVNKVARTAKTKSIRAVREAANFDRVGLVRDVTTISFASKARPFAEITMRSGWQTLKRHHPSPRQGAAGKPFRRAKPWGTSRTYQKAFHLSNGLPAIRTSGARFPVKVLHGASAARELERPKAQDQVTQYVGERLPAEVQRYSKYMLSRL